MWRSKKLIICVALALVLLLGSLGGVAFAQENEDGRPGAVFLEKLAEKLGISVDELQAKITEVREDVREELPERNFGPWAGKRCPTGDPCILEERFGYGPIAQVFESLGYDTEDVKAAFEEARDQVDKETLAGNHRALISKVLEILGIDEDEWKAACQEICGDKPINRAFGPRFSRGMGGMCGFGFPCPPAE